MASVQSPVKAVSKEGNSQEDADAVLDRLWSSFEQRDSTCKLLDRLKISSKTKRSLMAFEIVAFILFLIVLTSGT
jgi:hypothetical protein